MKKIWMILTVLFLVGTVLVLGFGICADHFMNDAFPIEKLEELAHQDSPRFYVCEFSDRSTLTGEWTEVTDTVFGARERLWLSSDEIPKALKDAFIAIEDKRFYTHGGIDFARTLAAIGNYLSGDGDSFGGSTITQQLVKNITGDREHSARRKLQEMIYAVQLERQYDKEEILAFYLNAIYFSDNCYGVAGAAEHYFGKSVDELTVAECASLAATVNNPTYYHPRNNTENNLQRRNLVLSEMQAQGMISTEEYTAFCEEELILTDETAEDGINSWYVDAAMEDILADLCETYALSREEASEIFYRGGLHIELAMDMNLQEIAEDYYRNLEMPRNKDGDSAESGIILIDPETGDILALVGGVGEKAGNRLENFATQAKRSPGSAIKPVSVYAPALEEGIINWATVYDDVPTEFGESGNTPWPSNATQVYRGLTNIAYAVAHSTNTVAVRVLADLGSEKSYRYATESFHLDSLVGNDKNASVLALGQLSDGLTLRELTTAYTVFADGGIYHPSRTYYRVFDSDGKVLLSNGDADERVLSAENAAIMTKLLEGVITDGTTSAVTLQNLTECAGKTGTTSDDRDRWFIGYTPELICGVFCGYPYPEPIKQKNLATGIWNDVMTECFPYRSETTAFKILQTVIRCAYCKDSGGLYTAVCAKDPRQDRLEWGWFSVDHIPTVACHTHILCKCDAEGGISHGFCPDEVEVALISVSRNFPIEVLVSDAQYVYGGTPTAMSPNDNPRESYYAKSRSGYSGKSAVEYPFNRSCQLHSDKTGEWDYLDRFFREE